jgi:long-chain fatty acid transport protein
MMRQLAALLVVLTPSASFAGGYTLPIQSVRALSVGGALVAGAEGGDAFWYNPARLGDSSLNLGVAIVALDATFTRAGGPQDGVSVSNEATPLPIPSVGLVWQLHERISIGVGAYAPFGGQHRFAEDGPQRYALVSNDQTKLLFVHLAAAVRFGDFRIGAGLQNVVASVSQRTMFSGYTGLFGWAEDPELDVLTELELHDPFTLTANFGASYDLGPVSFGASLQLPYSVGGEGLFRVRLPSSPFFDSASVDGNRVRVEIPFPLSVRGGVRWQIIPELAVEGAVNFEGWSVQDEVRIEPVDRITLRNVPSIGDYALGAVVLPRRMRDTFSMHLGADGQIMDGLNVRGGAFYEPSAFGDETFSVAVMDGDKLGLTLGVSFDVGPVRVDVAAARIMQATRTVDNSEITQNNPTNPTQTETVGNGTYESGFWTAGVGASWRFGAGG